jgi:hypothetical protein
MTDTILMIGQRYIVREITNERAMKSSHSSDEIKGLLPI